MNKLRSLETQPPFKSLRLNTSTRDKMDRLQALKDFLAEDPDDAFTRFALAAEYRKRGELERAREFFEGLVDDHPDYVGTYYHLGKLYEEVGQTAQAIEAYRSGIQVAEARQDHHARAELQSALLEAEGFGFDDED